MPPASLPAATHSACEEKYLRFLSEAGTALRAASGGIVANGYTSEDQAAWIAEQLELSSGDTLLDLGGGRGWPGGLIAERSGARLVSLDLPLEALRQGRAYLLKQLGPRAWQVCGDGRLLPLGDGHFSAVCHTDVLC